MPDQTPHPGATERPGALDEPVMFRWESRALPRGASRVEVTTYMGPADDFAALEDRGRWSVRELEERPGWVAAVRIVATS